MYTGLQTCGEPRHIRPFITLATGLEAAGHEVTLAATSKEGLDYGGLVSNLPIG